MCKDGGREGTKDTATDRAGGEMEREGMRQKSP